MHFSDLSIGKKLGLGFGAMIVLLMGASYTGYNGIASMGHALFVVGDEEAPLVEMANEMKLSLMVARNSMEEYKGATSVMASNDESALDGILANYRRSVEDFDRYTDAILNGGRIGDLDVLKTDNPELARLAEAADGIHNNRFQKAAAEMIKEGKALLEGKVREEAAMLDMEQKFDRIEALADELETDFKRLIETEESRATSVGAYQRLLTRTVPLVDVAMELKNAIAGSRMLLEELAQQNELSKLEGVERDYRETIETFDVLVRALQSGGRVDGDRIYALTDAEMIEDVRMMDAAHGEFQAAADNLIEERKTMIQLAISADKAMAELDRAGEEAEQMLNQVEGVAGGEMSAAKREGAESKSRVTTLLITVALISVALGAFLGWIITRAITTPLSSAVVAAERIADGDLTHDVPQGSKDETGQLLNAVRTMKDRLLHIVTEARQGADSVSSASNQIAVGSADLSQRTEEQASSLEETASSMEEMTSTVRQNADNASQANQLAAQSKDLAVSGGEVVQDAVGAMGEINRSSKQIADIIGVIDEIAFQTNLLALNAAVEAARAGEQGRGFAVVAGEVRKLAQRSADSAKDIKELITDSVTKIDHGSQLVDRSGETLGEILSSVKKVSDIVAEIAAASQEQSSGIEQVNKAITQMDQVTQQNAALVEETAAASDALKGQAASLQQQMSFFNIGDRAVSITPAQHISSVSAQRAAPKPSATQQSAGTGQERPQAQKPTSSQEGVWEEF